NPTPLPAIDLLLPAARLQRFQAYSEQLRTRLRHAASCGLRLGVLHAAFLGALPDCATSRNTRRQGAEIPRRPGKTSRPDPTPSPDDRVRAGLHPSSLISTRRLGD